MATDKKAISKLTPAPGYLLIEPLAEEKKTASGIVLPDSHEEKPQEGRVVAVGPAMITEYGTKIEAPCRKGQVVVFKKWAGNEYKPEGEETEYLFVKFDDVLAVQA
jgi:chaperonin GroES